MWTHLFFDWLLVPLVLFASSAWLVSYLLRQWAMNRHLSLEELPPCVPEPLSVCSSRHGLAHLDRQVPQVLPVRQALPLAEAKSCLYPGACAYQQILNGKALHDA